VSAQDPDRSALEPAYLYLLREEFAEKGTRLKALSDRGDDSPEGQLTDGILDQLAKFERAKTAERTRRGRLRKAREGKVIAWRQADYGFRYNTSRDGYTVHEGEMNVVRRIFHITGEGNPRRPGPRGKSLGRDTRRGRAQAREVPGDVRRRCHDAGRVEVQTRGPRRNP
jgi:DNA invertase Pin-like site-specific DNA recombinase